MSAIDLSMREVLNDGPSFLAILCPMIVYGGSTIAKGRLFFEPKIHANYRLIIQGTPDKFHCLNRIGTPVQVVRIWEEQHRTTKSLWLACEIGPTDLRDGDPTWFCSNDASNNAVIIDCNPAIS